jgi:heavy metal translocating P-type ATPase
VYAGTLATDSALICRVTRRPQDTRLAHIIQLVDQSLAAKPSVQRLADQASAYFTFAILGIAALTFAGWWSTGHDIAQGLLAAAAVLVVACPCALGLATPFAFTVTMTRAARAGIWVRNPAAFETAANIRRVVFDKTGTLTRGQMSVVATTVDRDASLSGEDLLCLAAAVEQYSEHPAAKAIVAACSRPVPAGRDFQASRGLGASARVAGPVDGRVMVGSRCFLGVNGDSALAAEAQTRAEKGQSIVWVGWGEGAAGFIALHDDPNPTAGEVLRRLQAAGIRPVMLSGDSPRTTRAVAAEVGLAEYEGNCTPGDKRSRIEAWQAAGERVAMVGDGVNDAPALAQADLSITVAGGADVAGETSDVVLTRPDLTLVPRFIHLCQRTRRVVRQNLGWAFAYNLLVVPLAALGLISPIIAAAAMSASSLLVVGNSLRLYRQ